MLKNFNQQSGIVLVLALLIIAVALTAASIFGNLIIKAIQQSRLIDQSIQAYYLAESGAERALHQTRKREALHDCTIVGGSACGIDGFCQGIVDQVPCISFGPGNLAGGKINWEVAALLERSISKKLKPGESFQIDLFNPYQETGASKLTTVEVAQITSQNLADFTLYGQMTNLTWFIGGTGICPAGSPIIANDFISGSAGSATISGLAGTDINPNCLYIFRIQNPLNQSLDTFTITLHSDAPATADNQVDIPSRLLITASADFGRSFQIVKVKTPIRPPLSGLYDFVLFSDTEIIKN